MKAKYISKRRNAFTLVEILIVVVILGILAAIVVPQFANATDEARGGNAVSQIQTLENQIELWRAREGTYPDLVGDQWANMILEDYIKTAPVSPYDNNPATNTVVGAVGDGTAWEYDVLEGTLTAPQP